MSTPKPTGAYTDEGGTLRCRATTNRCLGHHQATELLNRARARGVVGSVEHCRLCSAWHYHKEGRLQGRPPRAPNKVRQWRKNQRRAFGQQ